MTFNTNKHKNDWLFIPLGGAGEIGMNFNLYHYKGKWLIVDCGAGFAEDYMPGIDIIVPDINFILKYKKDILGIVITHCHEDHLGAVQYYWEMLDCPIYTSPFTASFLRGRLKDNDVKINNKIYEVKNTINLKPFNINFIPLCHSAPEMHALVISTEFGNVFHTGDWKYDDDPILGEVNNERLLKNWGENGILALIGDSTNIFNEDYSGSEGELKNSLYKLIKEATGTIVVTTFASNVARLDALFSIAKKLKKKVVISGKSIIRIMAAAHDCGYLTNYNDLIIDDRDIGKYKREKILIIATGCQGEPLAATTKIANQIHKRIKLVAGDTVIFSSKIIPGNEKKIFRVFNALVKQKIEVLTERDHFVHVSGHPSRKELKRLYNLLKPKTLIPVHGEHVHMHAHGHLGKELNIPNILEIENGSVVKLAPHTPQIIDKVETGKMGVYGKYFLSSSSKVMKIRRRLQHDGIFIAYINLTKKNKLVSDPIIYAPGYIEENEDKDLIYYINNEIINLINFELGSKKNYGEENIKSHVKSLIKAILKNNVGKIPEIKILIQRV